MKNFWESTIKYAVLIINFLFALAGVILMGVGAYVQVSAKHYLDFLSETYFNTPIFIIIAGAVIFIIAFFGCCGAWRESPWMIYTYAAFLCVILTAEVAAGIAAIILKGNLKEVIRDRMRDGMENYGQEGYESVTATWDLMQHDLHCCGSGNYSEWRAIGHGVPDSCCKEMKEDCGKEPVDTDEIYTVGCLELFERQFTGNMGIVGGVIIGVVMVQVLVVAMGLLLSYCLARRIQDESGPSESGHPHSSTQVLYTPSVQVYTPQKGYQSTEDIARD